MIKVGQEFAWHRGGTCKITEIKSYREGGIKIKFDVLGLKCSMRGSMPLEVFTEMFSSKKKK